MASKKTVKKIENVAIKSADDIAKDIQQIQQKTREALSVIDAAFLEKQKELSDVTEAIKQKSDELEELHGKEAVIMSIEEMKDNLEDQKHSNKRAIAKLKVEYEDNRVELERNLKLLSIQGQQEIQDENRARKIAHEDEDRARKIAFEEQENNLLRQQAELDERALELGSFDDRLNEEIDKAKGMAERYAQIEIRQKETEHKAIVDILEAKLQQSVAEIEELKLRLETAETTSRMANEKVVAIANSALDKESERKVAERVGKLATEFAASPKR